MGEDKEEVENNPVENLPADSQEIEHLDDTPETEENTPDNAEEEIQDETEVETAEGDTESSVSEYNPNNLKEGFGRDEFAKRVRNNNYYKEEGEKLKDKQRQAKETTEKARQEKENEYKKKDKDDKGTASKEDPNSIKKTNKDKFNDNKNIAKSKINEGKSKVAGVGNKVNDLKSKAYMAQNPKEAATAIAKEEFKKRAQEVLIKVTSAILKNPYVLGAIGIIIGLLFLIIIVASIFGGSGNSNMVGLNGYSYIESTTQCDTYTVTKSGATIDSGVTLDDAVAVILMSEISVFDDSEELLKAFAVAIRSFVLEGTTSESCTINGNQIAYDTSLKSTALDSSSVYYSASYATKGLVLYKDNDFISGYFHAFCYAETVGNDYVIYYGENDCFMNDDYVEGVSDPDDRYDCQDNIFSPEEQYIPIDFIENLSYTVPDSYFESECNKNHPSGMSQFGAYYLATEEGYTFDNLLTYYYGDSLEIVSIYQSGNYYGSNYLGVTTNGANDQLTTDLGSVLESMGTSTEEYNEYLYTQITEAGVGTRAAVVAAAVSLVANLYESYSIRLPYTLSGGHGVINYGGVYGEAVSNYYGIDPAWGSKFSTQFAYHYTDGNTYYYSYFGLDCSGFVQWALHNAGFYVSSAGADTQGYYGEQYLLSQTGGSNYYAQPGDLLWHSGHIMLIVGVDYDAGYIYIAHASSGTNGIKINAISTSDSSNYVVAMDSFYETHSSYTEEEFDDLFWSKTLSS